MSLFATKTVSSQTQNQSYRFGCKKAQKIVKNLMKMIFSKNIDSQLSKDVPIVFKTFLEHILGFDVIWSKKAKIAILAIFS